VGASGHYHREVGTARWTARCAVRAVFSGAIGIVIATSWSSLDQPAERGLGRRSARSLPSESVLTEKPGVCDDLDISLACATCAMCGYGQGGATQGGPGLPETVLSACEVRVTFRD
jgi:hypothetical protein